MWLIGGWVVVVLVAVALCIGGDEQDGGRQ